MTNNFYKPTGLYTVSLGGTNASAVVSTAAVDFMAVTSAQLETTLRKHSRELPVTLDLPSDLLLWIGKIASHWAVVEWVQSGTYARLLGITRREARVNFGDRIGNCLPKIKQNMEMKDIPVPANFPDLSRRLNECEQNRNLLCHGIWMLDGEVLCVQNPAGEWRQEKQETVSKRKYPEAVYPDDAWLIQKLEAIKSALQDIRKIDEYLDGWLPPSPKII